MARGTTRSDSWRDYGPHVLGRSLLILTPTLLLVTAIFAGAGDTIFEPQTRQAFVPMLCVADLLLVGAMAALRLRWWKSARALVFSTTAICVAFAIAYTGGFVHSVASPTLLLPPMLAFALFEGRRSWLIAVAGAAPTTVTELGLRLFDVHLPDYTSKANPAANALVVFGACYLMLSGVLGTMGGANRRLRYALAAERDMHRRNAVTDALTGLLNRRGLFSTLETLFVDAQRGERHALFYLDLDGFKALNDEFGHDAGDHMLRIVAHRLTSTLPDARCISRLGGDEFAVLIAAPNEPQALEVIRAQIEVALARPTRWAGREVHVAAAVGHALIPDDGQTPDMVVATADQRMLHRKERAPERQANGGRKVA